MTSTIKVDTIAEHTSGGGVTVDGLTIKDGGITATTGATVFNEASADIDFRVESNANANRFKIDGGDDVVVMGTGTVEDSIYGAKPALQLTGTDFNTSAFSIIRNAADANSPNLIFGKSRSADGNTVVQDGDDLGNITFAAADGTDQNNTAARIYAEVDGTPGANDTPGRLVFATTADGANSATERVRITNDGKIGIGTSSSPAAKIHLDIGTDNLGLYINSTDATAGFALADNGGSINLATTSSGAFRVMTGGSANTAADGSAVSMLIDANGAVTKPLQPAFSVKPSSNQTNLGNNDTIAFGTETFDQNADFASNTFTAPVTGKYLLSFMVRLDDIAENSDYAVVDIVTSNREYLFFYSPGTSDEAIGFHTFSNTLLCDMDANDTAKLTYQEAGGTTGQADVSANNSRFTGVLIC